MMSIDAHNDIRSGNVNGYYGVGVILGVGDGSLGAFNDLDVGIGGVI